MFRPDDWDYITLHNSTCTLQLDEELVCADIRCITKSVAALDRQVHRLASNTTSKPIKYSKELSWLWLSGHHVHPLVRCACKSASDTHVHSVFTNLEKLKLCCVCAIIVVPPATDARAICQFLHRAIWSLYAHCYLISSKYSRVAVCIARNQCDIPS